MTNSCKPAPVDPQGAVFGVLAAIHPTTRWPTAISFGWTFSRRIRREQLPFYAGLSGHDVSESEATAIANGGSWPRPESHGWAP